MLTRIKAWRARRRWQRDQPAREAWVTLRDASGTVVATVPTVLSPSEPGQWVNVDPVVFQHFTTSGVVASLTMVDADGKRYDADL